MSFLTSKMTFFGFFSVFKKGPPEVSIKWGFWKSSKKTYTVFEIMDLVLGTTFRLLRSRPQKILYSRPPTRTMRGSRKTLKKRFRKWTFFDRFFEVSEDPKDESRNREQRGYVMRVLLRFSGSLKNQVWKCRFLVDFWTGFWGPQNSHERNP